MIINIILSHLIVGAQFIIQFRRQANKCLYQKLFEAHTNKQAQSGTNVLKIGKNGLLAKKRVAI